MSNDERKARSLQRWLEEPAGTAPPDDVDSDAVEAIFALRPDLAPRPRVSADDILALVTKGPLAGAAGSQTPSGGERAGEVVPFPARPSPPSASDADESTPVPAPRRRGRGAFLALVGGTGGLGLALVAAATLLVVAVPALQERSAPFPTAAQEASPAASSWPSPVPAPAPVAITSDAPPPPVSPAAEAVPRPAASAPARAPSGTAGGAVARDMADGRVRSGASEGIPELDEVLSKSTANTGDAVAMEDEEQAAPELDADDVGADAVAMADETLTRELEQAPVAAAPPPAQAEMPAELESVAESKRRDRTEQTVADEPVGWRAGVDADRLSRIDQAIEKANALRQRGDYRGAADRLAREVTHPARSGQYVAGLAASDYLAAGDFEAAAGIAAEGLSLSSESSPERSLLQILYGDAQQRMEQPGRAYDAYEEADVQNQGR